MEPLELFRKNRFVPVCVLDRIEDSLKISELLLKNGFNTIEVTLRTDQAFECIGAISREFPELIIGAGTVLERDEVDRLSDLGVKYALSPVLDRDLASYSIESGIYFIPGVATPSELLEALKYSEIVKIFPSQVLGGVKFIEAVTGPFKKLDFSLMPTGGIDETNFLDYLAMDRVCACGMSYPVAGGLVRDGKFDIIDERLSFIKGEIEKSG